MDVKETIKAMEQGFKPEIEFIDGIGDMEGADPGMRARILSLRYEDRDCMVINVDMKPYESYNRTVAVPDWGDEKQTWFDTKFYPADGQWSFYIDSSGKYPLPFRILSEKSNRLMAQFIQENSGTTYIEWLESQIP